MNITVATNGNASGSVVVVNGVTDGVTDGLSTEEAVCRL